LCGIDILEDPNVIVGLRSPDDAGVYKINDELAIIQTVDFFTPVVDVPYWFGQIAVANALSDVYAMGGTPKMAMNLVAFPSKDMDISVLQEILRGGIDKLKEANVVLIGGHSVEDQELKYGLSVTGFIHPDKIITKKGIKEGDILILTKPLGTGIIATGIKGGLVSKETVDFVTNLMATLNKDASEIMRRYDVHACTDITGFGLIGHMSEMIQGTGLSIAINVKELPIIPEAREYASMGLIPAGTYKNMNFWKEIVKTGSVDEVLRLILFDPQTSGGLLICCDPSDSNALLKALRDEGIEDASVIGRVIKEDEENIIIGGG